MDGDDVSTSDVQRLADVVMARAMTITEPDGSLRYDLTPGKKTGGRTRLARDAGMDHGQLSRLLSGERMPDVRLLARLARCLGTTIDTLLTESDNYPAQTPSQQRRESVGSPSLTPDAVADSWGADRADVRAMFEILRKKPRSTTADDHDGRAEAQG